MPASTPVVFLRVERDMLDRENALARKIREVERKRSRERDIQIEQTRIDATKLSKVSK